ncbi:hypothetical protein [Nannocystis exedens]|uniref:hypothetical protein n=1 Tax=Nannocystis exedens TaxID=54 RepID=UPI001474979F|nr:hypothetical protein [Nannocystis exedens]
MSSSRGAAVVLAAALGCGSDQTGATDSDTDTGTGTGTTGEAITLAEFFDLAEETYCGWAVRCGAFAEAADCRAVEFFETVYPPRLLAEARLDYGETGQAVEYLLASEAAGRLVFDAEAAASCLAYVEARGCALPGAYAAEEAELAGQAACNAILRGTMVENGPCLLSVECAPQEAATMVCGFDPSCSEACCLGGCRRLASLSIGTPCNGNSRCQEGSFCGRDANTGMFTVCTAKQPVGAACLGSDECDAEGYCDFNTGECRALAGEGEPCSDFGDGGCRPGLYCADPGYLGNGRCYAFAPLGGACLADWYLGCSALGSVCDPQGEQCVVAPGPGESCADRPCGLTSSCEWYSQECVALAREGEPCGDSIRCAGALQCDGWDPASARCRAPEVTGVCAVPGEDELPQGT